VTLANENACPVFCRFKVEGPFKINVVEQAGKKPVYPLVIEKPKKRNQRPTGPPPDDPLRQLFAVPSRNTVTILVEFVPSMCQKHPGRTTLSMFSEAMLLWSIPGTTKYRVQ